MAVHTDRGPRSMLAAAEGGNTHANTQQSPGHTAPARGERARQGVFAEKRGRRGSDESCQPQLHSEFLPCTLSISAAAAQRSRPRVPLASRDSQRQGSQRSGHPSRAGLVTPCTLPLSSTAAWGSQAASRERKRVCFNDRDSLGGNHHPVRVTAGGERSC